MFETYKSDLISFNYAYKDTYYNINFLLLDDDVTIIIGLV